MNQTKTVVVYWKGEKDREYQVLERTDLESLTDGGKDNLEIC